MKIRYIYSACQEVTIGDFTLLTDPWLKDGAFYGSWCLAYKPGAEAEELNPNAVWVSHIHPDHYNPATLRIIDKPLMIADSSVYLEKVAIRDGFSITKLEPEWTRLSPFLEVMAIQYDDIDSVLLARSQEGTVLFAVDTPISEKFANRILSAAGKIDLAYLPYAGAGAWPQCYRMRGHDVLTEAAEKQKRFLDKTVDVWKLLNKPAVVLYAGEYLLGGRLYDLNFFRGNPTREEAHSYLHDYIPNLVEVLPGGTVELVQGASIIIEQGQYIHREPDPKLKFSYDGCFEGIDIKSFPIIRTVEACAKRMVTSKTRFSEEDRQQLEQWSLVLVVSDCTFSIDLNSGAVNQIRRDQIESIFMRLEVHVSTAIFLSAATSMTHWNNLEIGSHLQFRRIPPLHLKSLHRLLSFFHI